MFVMLAMFLRTCKIRVLCPSVGKRKFTHFISHSNKPLTPKTRIRRLRIHLFTETVTVQHIFSFDYY